MVQINPKLRKIKTTKKGFALQNWNLTSNTTTTNNNKTDLPGAVAQQIIMSNDGNLLVELAAPVSVSSRTLILGVLLDAQEYNMIVTNSTTKAFVSGSIIIPDVSKGTHSIKARWNVQTAGDTGTMYNYETATLKAIEL